jgi:hypothetical protein
MNIDASSSPTFPFNSSSPLNDCAVDSTVNDRNVPSRVCQQGLLQTYQGHRCRDYNVNATFFHNEDFVVTGSEQSEIVIYDKYNAQVVCRLKDKTSSLVHLVAAHQLGGNHPVLVSAGAQSDGLSVWSSAAKNMNNSISVSNSSDFYSPCNLIDKCPYVSNNSNMEPGQGQHGRMQEASRAIFGGHSPGRKTGECSDSDEEDEGSDWDDASSNAAIGAATQRTIHTTSNMDNNETKLTSDSRSSTSERQSQSQPLNSIQRSNARRSVFGDTYDCLEESEDVEISSQEQEFQLLLQRALVEEVMSKYGEQLLLICYKNQLSFSDALACIIEQVFLISLSNALMNAGESRQTQQPGSGPGIMQGMLNFGLGNNMTPEARARNRQSMVRLQMQALSQIGIGRNAELLLIIEQLTDDLATILLKIEKKIEKNNEQKLLREKRRKERTNSKPKYQSIQQISQGSCTSDIANVSTDLAQDASAGKVSASGSESCTSVTDENDQSFNCEIQLASPLFHRKIFPKRTKTRWSEFKSFPHQSSIPLSPKSLFYSSTVESDSAFYMDVREDVIVSPVNDIISTQHVRGCQHCSTDAMSDTYTPRRKKQNNSTSCSCLTHHNIYLRHGSGFSLNAKRKMLGFKLLACR